MSPDASTDFPEIPAFDFDPRTRVIFGRGVLDRLGDVVRELGGRRILLVTDPGLRDAGHERRAINILEQAGLQVAVFDDVAPNPTTECVERGTAFAQGRDIDFLVGLGGGSSMDCAKGVNFLLTNGGRMEDYWGVGKATRPMLPLVAVPTTAGTGSEAQSFAVISQPDTHLKMACGDKKAAARAALLDPDLTLTMPSAVTAATGIDAISHAVESYVSTARTPISELFARRAWRLLHRAFPRVLAAPQDVQARGAMLLGAHLAGAAIENSMLGAAHALANPLSAAFDVVHGPAVGMMLPHVVRYNAAVAGPLYADLEADAGLSSPDVPPGWALARFLDEVLVKAGLPSRLSVHGVTAAALPGLAEQAARQWTGRFNPRSLSESEFQEIYACALPTVQ